MKKFVFVLCMIACAVLAGCADAGSSASESGGKKYVIRSGTTTTVFTMDANKDQLEKSVYTDADNNVTTRTYSYDSNNELAEVRCEKPSADVNIITYASESDRADSRKTKKITTVTESRGTVQTRESDYIYNDNGTAVGIIQTDSNNNKYAKGIEQ